MIVMKMENEHSFMYVSQIGSVVEMYDLYVHAMYQVCYTLLTTTLLNRFNIWYILKHFNLAANDALFYYPICLTL